ncbi:MAG: hypothetical protein M3Y60_11410, partial [Bacteroidota bacterium]|nr:hypothetical protein [Bacteroidota bacterium]
MGKGTQYSAHRASNLNIVVQGVQTRWDLLIFSTRSENFFATCTKKFEQVLALRHPVINQQTLIGAHARTVSAGQDESVERCFYHLRDSRDIVSRGHFFKILFRKSSQISDLVPNLNPTSGSEM